MDVNYFQILLIDVTFDLWHVQKLVFTVLIKIKIKKYNRGQRLKGYLYRENYSNLTKWRWIIFKSCWLMSRFIFDMFKSWYL